MRIRTRFFTIATAGAILAATAVARAETWPLEVKRLESANRFGSRSDYIYRATGGQHFFVQTMQEGNDRIQFSANDGQTAAFKKIVKKEPKYECNRPFRGIAKLGLQEYAFALDATPPPKPEAKEAKPETEKAKAEKAKAETASGENDSLIGQWIGKLLGTPLVPAKKPAVPPVTKYDRLYFDFNHNGDLTDDKVVEAEKTADPNVQGVRAYSQIQFPRIDVTLDLDGTKMDYSFFLGGVAVAMPGFSYVSMSINAAAYREGEITLEGKKRRVVVIDFNSTGRFNDEIKIRANVHGNKGQIYPEQGDMLLIDPGSRSTGFDSPYDVTSADYRHNVSKLVHIDSRFYELKITTAGDKLTLTPSSAALGNVKNPNDGFRALIYGDKGFLSIHGNKGVPIPVPEGEWKLLSYTIHQTTAPKPIEPAKKKEIKEEPRETSLVQSLGKALRTYLGDTDAIEPPGLRFSRISAQATADYKAVKVVKGETVEIPFGPPYKPVVTASPQGGPKQTKLVHLEMSLIGSTGEVSTNLMVNGRQPAKPEFTITNAKGEVVEQGNFEYG